MAGSALVMGEFAQDLGRSKYQSCLERNAIRPKWTSSDAACLFSLDQNRWGGIFVKIYDY